MKKKAKAALAIVCLFILIILSAGFYAYKQISPLSSEQGQAPVRFQVAMGTSAYTIAYDLQKEGLIKNAKFFYYFIRYPKLLQTLYPSENIPSQINLKSGIYHLEYGLNYAQLVNILSSGQQEYIKVAIPEGKTISQIGAILQEAGICDAIEFKNTCYSAELLQEYKLPGDSAEGFLFPETYYFTAGMTCNALAGMMIETFFEKIQSIPELAGKSAEEIYNTVILASIVEREYRVPEEAPLIASVFTNRLRNNIGLYSCATIVYILTEIQGKAHPDRVLLEDTKIDSPYNTYKWAGLTPGPISNPGLIALSAAANPPKTNYYFFQVSDSQQGKHVFTTTFDEHKASHNLSTKK